MGDYKLFWVTCFVVFLFLHEISTLNSKLDFGDDSKPSLVNNQRSIQFKQEKSDDLDKIAIVCTSNCDKKQDEKAKIETDVVVHVKSSVSLENTTKKVEEVPDIPIVLGTKGSDSKNEYPSAQRGLQFQPISRSFQENNAHLTPINIQNVFPSLVPGSLTNNGIEVSMKTFPGVVSLPDGYKYRTDGLEIKVPYFEPTFHKHYYGENSPPQFAYYPVKKSFKNPVAFNNVQRPAYSFSPRNYPAQNRRHDENCVCENHAPSGLTWYPTSNSHVQRLTGRRGNNFQAAIDDKIAPLN